MLSRNWRNRQTDETYMIVKTNWQRSELKDCKYAPVNEY